MKYWINCVSKDHVLKGMEGGFTQADHGRNSRLRYLEKGDFIIFYSPKTQLRDREKLQAFTALAQITDEIPYQVQMTPDFHPWRRKAKFYNCSEVSVHDVLNDLVFIHDKKHWGFPFRRGLFSIGKEDFDTLFSAMQVEAK